MHSDSTFFPRGHLGSAPTSRTRLLMAPRHQSLMISQMVSLSDRIMLAHSRHDGPVAASSVCTSLSRDPKASVKQNGPVFRAVLVFHLKPLHILPAPRTLSTNISLLEFVAACRLLYRLLSNIAFVSSTRQPIV